MSPILQPERLTKKQCISDTEAMNVKINNKAL